MAALPVAPVAPVAPAVATQPAPATAAPATAAPAPRSAEDSRSLSDILHNNSKKDSIIPRVMNSTASISEGVSEIFEQMILQVLLILP